MQRSRKLTLPSEAKTVPLPTMLRPELATLVKEPPRSDNGEWLYELKFDGYRMVARADGKDIRLITRNGNDWTSKLRPLATEIAALKIPGAWLDGEIVVFDADGKPSFQALQKAFDTSKTIPIHYFVFDLPYYAGHNLSSVPLIERRALLRSVLAKAAGRVQFSEDFDTPIEQLLPQICAQGLEGVIGKRKDSRYTEGRSRDWIKLKCLQRQEFMVGGYTDPQRSRQSFGGLLLGVYDEGGALHYIGGVGTGFSEQSLRSISAQLHPLETKDSPFASYDGPRRGVHWVKPRLVAEVAFSEWTQDAHIRHPSFQSIRIGSSPPFSGYKHCTAPRNQSR